MCHLGGFQLDIAGSMMAVNVNVVPSLWVSVGRSVVAVNVNVVLSLWVSVGCSRHCGGGEC